MTTDSYPRVQGRCPTCGSESLFLGEGGYVTCSWIECSRPDHASDVLGAHAPHDCETCTDCLHDGHECCGCYDGSCCHKKTPEAAS